MFAVGTLSFSLLTVVVLFLFKHWELKNRKKINAEWRSKADIFVAEHVPRMHENTLEIGKHLSRRVLVSSIHYIAVISLNTVRSIEKKLVGVVDMIKGKRKVENSGNTSSYLMKVSEHKRNNNSRLGNS